MNRLLALVAMLPLPIPLLLPPAGAPADGDALLFIQSDFFLMGSPESGPWRGTDETLHAVTGDCFH